MAQSHNPLCAAEHPVKRWISGANLSEALAPSLCHAHLLTGRAGQSACRPNSGVAFRVLTKVEGLLATQKSWLAQQGETLVTKKEKPNPLPNNLNSTPKLRVEDT